MHFMHSCIHAYMHHPDYLLCAAITAAYWVREEGRLVKRTVTSTEMADSSDNTRMDQLENNMNKMAEQLQAIANAIAAGQNGGTGANGMRQEGLDSRTAEEIPTLDDDMAEYATGRAAGPQAELQKLREQVESVTRKMKGKHEDLLDYDAMAFK